MRSLFYLFSALVVIVLAFWAYRENYETQAAQEHAEQLQDEIALARQRLRALNAEWAYLNRPDRLLELAELNYDKLGLQPLQYYQFGRVNQVAFPPEKAADVPLMIENSVEVSTMETQP